MNNTKTGQLLLILCCIVYLIWWYRGFRPNTNVSRVGGVNGILLLITAALGMAGLILSLMPIEALSEPPIAPEGTALPHFQLAAPQAAVVDIAAAVVIHQYGRIDAVTARNIVLLRGERAGGIIGPAGFAAMCVVIAAAFAISIVLYVAYYRMEEMKALYAAMVPLVTEALAMAAMVAAMGSGG